MASEEDRQLLIQVANMAPNPAAREEAAARYRQIFDQDVPVFEGPVLEDQARMGPASRIPTSAPPAAEPPSTVPGSPGSKRVEQGMNRVNDIITFGAWPAITDALAAHGVPGFSSRARREALEQDPEATVPFEIAGQQGSLTNMVGDTAGGLAGMVAGPAKMLGDIAMTGGQKVAQFLAPYTRSLPGVVQRGLGVAGRALLGAGTGVAANAAANVAHEGPPIPTDMNKAMQLFDTVTRGAPTAALLGAGGELGGMAATRGQRTLRTVGAPEGEKNWIGKYAEHKERGAYNKPKPGEIQRTREGSVEGMRDVQDAANEAIDRAAQADLDLTRQSHAQTEADWAPLNQQPVSRAKIEANLLRQQQANINPQTGGPYNPHLDSVIRAELTRVRQTPEGSQLLGPDGQPISSPAQDFTVESVRRYRQEARKNSSKGKPGATDAQRDADVAYNVWRQALHEEIPGAKGIDERATARANEGRERRDIMFRSENEVAKDAGGGVDPDEPTGSVTPDELGEVVAAADDAAKKGAPKIRPWKRQAGARTLYQIGNTTQGAKNARAPLERLREMDPELAAALDLIEAKKAQVGTSPSLKNEIPVDLPGMAEGGGFFGPLVRQNLRFVGARLVDPALSMGARLAPKTALMVPFLRNPIDALLSGKKDDK